MDNIHETIILETDNVRITDVRAFIGWKTYEIADIMSASLTEKNPSPAAGKARLIVSLLALVIGILSCVAALSIRFIAMIGTFWGWPQINLHFLFAVLGLLFISLWSIGWESHKSTYIVEIETASGKSQIFGSKDKDHVQKVALAINNAVARRGER